MIVERFVTVLSLACEQALGGMEGERKEEGKGLFAGPSFSDYEFCRN